MRAQGESRKHNEFVMAFLQMIVTLGMNEEDLGESDVDLQTRENSSRLCRSISCGCTYLWHGREDPFPAPTPTHYEDRKVGLKRTCPCGTGKKFKRCCGSPTASFH
jgi:hypothetical protein